VYSTTTKTIISCHPTVTLCPAHSTVVTTVVIPVSTTICPITYSETPQPSWTSYPQASVTLVAPTGYPTAVPSYTEVPPPPPPASSYEASAPPPAPTAAETSVGTIGAPTPTTSGLTEVTAGAAIQRAGGALAVVALAAALI